MCRSCGLAILIVFSFNTSYSQFFGRASYLFKIDNEKFLNIPLVIYRFHNNDFLTKISLD